RVRRSSGRVIKGCLLSRGLVMPLESDRIILLKQLVPSTAGLLGHSFTLVADGLESAADVVSGLVVLFCSVLFCSVLFCSVLFCSFLFCSVRFGLKLSVKLTIVYGLPREEVAGWKFNAESHHPLHRTH